MDTPDALSRAVRLYHSGAFPEAARAFALLRQAAPDDPVLLRLHGLTLVRPGDPEAGVELLSRAREASPTEPLSHLHLGIGLHAAGRLAEAIAAFRTATAMMPDASAPLVNLAVALLDLDDATAAREVAARAVRLDPRAGEAHLALGRAYAAAGDMEAARAALQGSVRLCPEDANAWVALGVARYRLADPDGAMAAMRRALHERLMAHWERALPIPMLSIALTDWIGDFDATLARVLDFLDLPPAPECERFHLSDRRVRTASRAQVRRPVNADGIGRWRKYQRELEPLIAELEGAGLLASPPPPG